MKVIGFAHITMVGQLQSKLVEVGLISDKPNLAARFYNLPNPVQKQSHQLARRRSYNLEIFDAVVPLEVLSFPGPKSDLSDENLGLGVSVTDSEVLLSSSSFGLDFLNSLCSLLSISRPTTPVVAGQKPRFVSFAFDPNAAEFSESLDKEGYFVSLAFFVRGLQNTDLSKFGDSFTVGNLEIGPSDFYVSFVRLGGCWVELLERVHNVH